MGSKCSRPVVDQDSAIDEEIDLRASMRAEEIKPAAGDVQILEGHDLLDHEAFETVAPRGRSDQCLRIRDTEQLVVNSCKSGGFSRSKLRPPLETRFGFTGNHS